MITLEAADLIEGDASAANVVDYIINGVQEASSVVSVKALGDGQLPASKGTLYTTPASTTAIVKSVILVNTDSSARTVNLYVQRDGSNSRRIIPEGLSLEANGGSAILADHLYVFSANGELLQSIAAPAHDLGGASHNADTLANLNTKVSDATLFGKEEFDANTILAADNDDTPTARTIAEQRVVGRLTGGNIGAIIIGIADNNMVQVDGSPNANEYARFTANGLEGRTEAEFKADFNLEIGTDVLAQQTIGIADNNLLEVDDAAAADDEYARFTANGLEGRTAANVRSDINVADGADVTGSNPPQAHKDSHDPNDGSDPLDTATPVKVGSANAEGTAHSVARSDHVHEREHAKYTDAEATTQAKAVKRSFAITVEDPSNSEDITIAFTEKAITITEIRAVLIGSDTPSVTWTIRHHATDRSNAGNEVVTGGTTTTSLTAGDDVTAFDDATIPADSFIWLETTAKSGTVSELHVTVVYTVD